MYKFYCDNCNDYFNCGEFHDLGGAQCPRCRNEDTEEVCPVCTERDALLPLKDVTIDLDTRICPTCKEQVV